MIISRRISSLIPFIKSATQIKPQHKQSLRRQLNFGLKNLHCFSTEKMEFKTQTKRLLDIVAKSLYTDSEVFIRQLLSNASDALEKQRFHTQSSEGLLITIELSPEKNQVVIQDNGIGMNRQEIINNLGTIARSGSKEYLEKLKQTGSNPNDENIIGQFGVGFYSSFIVADQVEVISRKEGENTCKWVSDGSGQFEIGDGQNSFERGTKIILHLKQEHDKFTDNTNFRKIINKYSNFINFPISVNNEGVNLVKAIWTRDKNGISQDEYKQFYKYMHNTDRYQYKMHFQSDVPLSIKSILFVPQTHGEKFGFGQQKGEVSLYSKKVLIKKDCKDLFPPFMRFMKGVVDCEDIPLNISRQSYQDSALMAKLKSFLTKRVLKHIRQQATKNPEQYLVWYDSFSNFIKEGSIDPQFKKDVIDLNRFEITGQEGFKTLKDYVNVKNSTQDRIFYMTSQNQKAARESPYVYPLVNAGIPVLISNSQIDEFIFREIDTYQGLKFANVETDQEDVERALKGAEQANPSKDEDVSTTSISEQDITGFSLWVKQELQPFVDKVVVTKKKISGPALVISPISTSMRQMAFMQKMMEKSARENNTRATLRNLTFEFNPKNDLMVKLNEFRKLDANVGSMIARQIFDNCCLEAGLEGDGKNMVKRINTLLDKYMSDKSQAKVE